MRKLIYLAIPILAVAVTYGDEIQSYRWPPVAPMSRTFHFSGSRSQGTSFTINGPSGNELYWLGCHTGSFEGNSGDPDHDDQDYFGDLDCHLHSLYAPDDGNLLVTDAVGRTENFSRLLTTASELQGACANYPEWGAIRHVTLRGMEITFTYKDTEIRHEIGGGGLGYDKSLTLAGVQLEVKVEPDPRARSAIALEPPFRYPASGNQASSPPQCDRVVRQHIPGIDIGDYARENRLGPPYSQVVPTEKIATFTLNEAKDWQMPILSGGGKEAYSLKCQAAMGETGLDRWGVGCKLVQGGNGLDLLADSVDPYSRRLRTLFEPEELDGKCSAYPEWGTNRTFKLRGFRLALQVNNVVLGESGIRRLGSYKGRVARFDIAAKVTPDQLAASPVALPSRYVDWRFLRRPGACERVVVDTNAPDTD